MAVAYETFVEVLTASSASPFTTTATVSATRANRLVLAFFGLETATGPATALALSWNGVDMGAERGTITSTNGWQIHLFALINPAAGTNLVLSASWTGGSNVGGVLSAAFLYDCDQVTGVKTFTSNSEPDNNPTPNVTIAGFTAGNMVIGARVDENGSSSAATTGTEIFEERAGNGNWALARSTTDTVAWSLGSSVPWAAAALEVIAFATAAGDETLQSRRMLSVP